MRKLLISLLVLVTFCSAVFAANELTPPQYYFLELQGRIEPGSNWEDIPDVPGQINVNGIMIQVGYSFADYAMGAGYDDSMLTGLTPVDQGSDDPGDTLSVDLAGNDPNLNDYINFYIAAAAQTEKAARATISITAGPWKYQGSGQDPIAISLSTAAYSNEDNEDTDYHVVTAVSSSSTADATFTITHAAMTNSVDWKIVGAAKADWVTSAEAGEGVAYLAGSYTADIKITVDATE